MATWMIIPDFPDYAASDGGEIKRVVADRCGRTGKVLKQYKQPAGYLALSLSRDGKEYTVAVHAIICSAFHGRKPTSKHQAAHNNGIRHDNRPDNLRWATAKENTADRKLHGTEESGDRHWTRRKPELVKRGTENGGGGKLRPEDIVAIRADDRMLREIAPDYGVSLVMISRIKLRKSWAHI